MSTPPPTQPAATQPSPAPHALTTPQLLYLWLAATSATCLLTADVIGIKLFQFQLPFPILGKTTIEHTAGMLTFPITFLITDLLNEYYGKRAARRVVFLSFAMAILAFVAFQIAQRLPHWDVPFNVKAEAFTAIFSSASVMYIASLCAYLVGNLIDIAIFGVLKRFTGGRMIWLRATGSTVISQMIDSFIVTWLAFSVGRQLFSPEGAPAAMPMHEVIKTAATGYTLKFFIAIGITPLLYLGHGLIHRYLKMQPVPPEHR